MLQPITDAKSPSSTQLAGSVRIQDIAKSGEVKDLVIILGDKDVVFLQESRPFFADGRTKIQEWDYYEDHLGQTQPHGKWCGQEGAIICYGFVPHYRSQANLLICK